MRLTTFRYQGAHLVALPSYAGDAAPPLVIDLDRYRVAAQLAGHVSQVFSARWVAEERVLTAGADGTAAYGTGRRGGCFRSIAVAPGSSPMRRSRRVS